MSNIDISREAVASLLAVWEMGGLQQSELHIVSDTCRALRAALDAEGARAVRVKPRVFRWDHDPETGNPSCYRCTGDGYSGYVLIPYAPGNDPGAGIGSWNVVCDYRGKVGFASREEATAYCEEQIRRKASDAVKAAHDALALWAEPLPPPTDDKARSEPDIIGAAWMREQAADRLAVEATSLRAHENPLPAPRVNSCDQRRPCDHGPIIAGRRQSLRQIGPSRAGAVA